MTTPPDLPPLPDPRQYIVEVVYEAALEEWAERANEEIERLKALHSDMYDQFLTEGKRAEAAERERDELLAADICDVCLGEGKTISGKPCMCSGSGRMSEAARYLREQLVVEQQASDELRARLKAIRAVVNEQAGDDGLWFVDAHTAPEAYLQQELRRLHAVIEWRPE